MQVSILKSSFNCYMIMQRYDNGNIKIMPDDSD